MKVLHGYDRLGNGLVERIWNPDAIDRVEYIWMSSSPEPTTLHSTCRRTIGLMMRGRKETYLIRNSVDGSADV